jgi:hypothetical protein
MGAELPVESLPHDLGAHGDSLLIDSGGLHRLMDLQKLQTQLGYHDVVSVPDAVAATATWLATHPPAPGGGLEEHIGDRFDYEQEDLLVGAYHAAVDQLRLLAPSRPEGFTPHSYAHPQAPGQLTDHRNR